MTTEMHYHAKCPNCGVKFSRFKIVGTFYDQGWARKERKCNSCGEKFLFGAAREVIGWSVLFWIPILVAVLLRSSPALILTSLGIIIVAEWYLLPYLPFFQTSVNTDADVRTDEA